MTFRLPNNRARGIKRQDELRLFASKLMEIQNKIGFKVSSRGWCYQLEQFRLINKDEFGRVENAINTCRKEGMLSIDFTAEEEGRGFANVFEPDDGNEIDHIEYSLQEALDCHESFIPDYWEDEEYYIQMVVEKIDLKTLFKDVCYDYRIPIATSKGWASMSMRAKYAKRFKEAEDRGLQCVLLYCGDHDPDGSRISDFLRSNLEDLMNITWDDGEEGYDPSDLIIDRFGLNADFIKAHNLTWINNLITGSGKNLANPSHKNYNMPYLQEYLKEFGARKCEANALVIKPSQGKQLSRKAIEKYLGKDAHLRFRQKRQDANDEINRILDEYNISSKIDIIIEDIREGEE